MFYYYPRTTLDMLRRYHEGIICCSACVSGIIPRMYFSGQPDKAKEWALTYKEIFGEDFYLEVQDHGLEDPSWGGFNDRTLSEQIVRLGRELGIKVIATNDNHYLTREDAPTQDILSCIGTASKVDDANRKRMTGTEFYIKTEQEMRALFPCGPRGRATTRSRSPPSATYELDWAHMIILPTLPWPARGRDLTSSQLPPRSARRAWPSATARTGRQRRDRRLERPRPPQPRVQRHLRPRASPTTSSSSPEYVQLGQAATASAWAPGRGSAAGALVAYAMDITTFDPLANGLMFERFLSPQRTEMPDIDMDFDDERRLEVDRSTCASSTAPSSVCARHHLLDHQGQAGHQRRLRASSATPSGRARSSRR